MPSCCTLLHSMVVVKGLGCFICRLPCGSLHSSNKNANSISKLNPASFAFYLGQLFLWPTASPSTMPVLSHHLCKLPSTASRSAFFPLLGSSTQGENVQDEFSDFFFFLTDHKKFLFLFFEMKKQRSHRAGLLSSRNVLPR